VKKLRCTKTKNNIEYCRIFTPLHKIHSKLCILGKAKLERETTKKLYELGSLVKSFPILCESFQSDIIDKVRKKNKKDLYSPSCPEGAFEFCFSHRQLQQSEKEKRGKRVKNV